MGVGANAGGGAGASANVGADTGANVGAGAKVGANAGGGAGAGANVGADSGACPPSSPIKTVFGTPLSSYVRDASFILAVSQPLCFLNICLLTLHKSL